ncbi:hypothetical protein [Dyadobacter sp. 22481]|uniref:hypothetical protein n=1 Tax=Dyadobacter sp. 22481 TaxID=3453926 RepID=UPI003F8609E7
MKDSIPNPIDLWSDIFFMAGRLVPTALDTLDRCALRMTAMVEKNPIKKQVMQNGRDGVNKDNLVDLMISVTMFSSTKLICIP